jgi:hypothetical protein
MKKSLAVLLLTAMCALPVSAAGKYPCYGSQERALAKQLLATVPNLAKQLNADRLGAFALRSETCSAISLVGTIDNASYAQSFLRDTRWRPVWVAANARQLDSLQVQAAIVDLHWPATKKKKVL